MTAVDTSMASEHDQIVVLHNVRWSTYEALLADLGDHRCRHVYDRGTLEIMGPSQSHERIKALLGRFLEMLTFELNLPMMSLGSTTMRRRDRRRGIEPDACYYIANEPAVRGKEIDFSRDPPPDLALEVDITSRSLRRLSVYAVLGVPEVWRWDGKTIVIHGLDPTTRSYVVRGTSSIFPTLPIAELVAFVDRRGTTDDNSLLRAFRDWIHVRFDTRAP
jgi:Uma2 family endonuclease